MFKKLLAAKPYSVDLGILIFRIVTAGILLLHGWPKLRDFSRWASDFRDPIGIGSTGSLILVIGAEVFCSALVLIGLFTRLALVPMIITMCVVIFVVHANDTVRQNEVPIFILSGCVAIFVTGPGKYSVDQLMK